MKHTACYVRVSTIGQNEAGQKREIQRWLERENIDPGRVVWYTDKRGGDNLDRPAFQKLQSDIRAGKVSAVVVWRLDRLSRSLRDGLNILCDWCDQKLRLASVSQDLDFKGTMGKMLAAMVFGIAEMEQQTRRERQAAGIAVAKERGVYRGRKPGSTKARPAEARRLRSRGWTDSEIAKQLGVSRATVQRYIHAA